MRKLFLLTSMVIIFISLSFVVYGDQKKQIPLDSTIKKGTLPNGLTYYIIKNKQPENMASFYILHNVGALQEDDNQVGLAHFLEHMAFNGTKNFPDKKLLTYMESIGVQFGRNINAYTSTDRTVYLVKNVPVSRPQIIDSALLVLHDWSHYISLEPDDVNAERGVIIEELRTGKNAGRRVSEASRDVLYNNSKLSKRNVIGTEEVLKSFKQEDIVGFYNDWYRPDLQAIVVSGDIDVDDIEKRIKERFSSIAARENPRPKEELFIEPYKEDIVKIVSDPELEYNSISVIVPSNLFNSEDNASVETYEKKMLYSFITSAMSERLSDVGRSENPPFISAGLWSMNRTANNSDTYIYVGTKANELEKGLTAVMTEVKRMKEFGLTQSEFDRIKASTIKNAEHALTNKDKRDNESFVNIATGNFFYGNSMIDPQVNLELVKSITDTLTLNGIKSAINSFIPDVKVAIVCTVMDKPEITKPTQESLMNAYKAGLNSNVEVIKESTLATSLLDTTLVKRVPIKKSYTDELGNTVWLLSNGAKVVVKKTDFKNKEIIFSAFENSGSSILTAEDANIAKIMLSYLASFGGVGEFSSNDLGKFMSGKIAHVGVGVSNYWTNMSGSCATSDLETMMQLINLKYTSPRFVEADYKIVVSDIKESLKNSLKTPETAFNDTVSTMLTKPNDRIFTTDKTEAKIDGASLDKVKEIYSKLFDGVKGTTFLFIGDIDMDKLQEYTEKYIATLPKGKYSKYVDLKLDTREGNVENIFKYKMTTPKSTVLIAKPGKNIPFNIQNTIGLSILKEVLSTKYLEIIREEKGATYGVGSSISIGKMPDDNYMFVANFDTNADVALEMSDIITQQIEEIAKNGIEDKYITKAKEISLKNYNSGLKNNNAWSSWITNYYQNDIDFREHEKIISSVNSDVVKALASKILETKNNIRIIMMPQE